MRLIVLLILIVLIAVVFAYTQRDDFPKIDLVIPGVTESPK